MITKPTVLVLGAGASMPYGFPSGDGLVKDVLTDSEVHTRLMKIGHTSSEIETYRSQLRESNPESVDFFLERRPEFMKIGKRSIATVLAALERPSSVQDVDEEEHWYKHLLHRLTTPQVRGFAHNRLGVITFNYDRSLEHFLQTSLRATYGLTDAKVQKLMSAIPIVHVHGSLGSLERGDGLDHRREYLREFTDTWLLGVDELIQVVSEVGADSEPYRDARAMLRGAERVVFLGFGYHKPNIVRLGLDDPDVEFKGEFMGSTHGFTDLERNGLEERWKFRVSFKDWTTLKYLREEVTLD